MRVERVTEATDELVEAFTRLLPQLTPGRAGPALGERRKKAIAPPPAPFRSASFPFRI